MRVLVGGGETGTAAAVRVPACLARRFWWARLKAARACAFDWERTKIMWQPRGRACAGRVRVRAVTPPRRADWCVTGMLCVFNREPQR